MADSNFKPLVSSPVIPPWVQLPCVRVFRLFSRKLKLVNLMSRDERGVMLIGYSPRLIITQQIGIPHIVSSRFPATAEMLWKLLSRFDDIRSAHAKHYYEAWREMTRNKDFVFLASMPYEDFVGYYSGKLLESTSRLGAYYIHPILNTIYRCIFTVKKARRIVFGHKFSSVEAFVDARKYPRNVVLAEDFVDRVLYAQIDYRSSEHRKMWPRYHLFCKAIDIRPIKIVPKSQKGFPLETEYDIRVWQALLEGAKYHQNNPQSSE